MAVKKRINIEPEKAIVDYDPLRKQQESTKTAQEVAEAGLETYLSTRAATYISFKDVSFTDESKALMNVVDELDAMQGKPITKSMAYKLQKYLHVGMMLRLKAESDPELAEIFKDLFNKSKRSVDRDS